MNTVIDTAALILILIGALLCLTAAIGLLRFRDVPTRLRAATKPPGAGTHPDLPGDRAVTAIVAGRRVPGAGRAYPARDRSALGPVVGRQAYRNGTVDTTGLFADELAESEAVRSPPAAGTRMSCGQFAGVRIQRVRRRGVHRIP